MDDHQNLSSCIENIKLKEQFEDHQRKEKRRYDDTISKLEKELAEMGAKQESVEAELAEIDRVADVESGIEADLDIKTKVLEDILKEQESGFETETKKLDEIHERIWQRREKYCEDVRHFIDSSGISAMLNNNFQKVKTTSSVTAVSTNGDGMHVKNDAVIVNEIKNIDDELKQRLHNIRQLKVELAESLRTKDVLARETEDGPEYIRLRSALNYSKEETKRMMEEMAVNDRKIDESENLPGTSQNERYQLIEILEPNKPSNTSDFPVQDYSHKTIKKEYPENNSQQTALRFQSAKSAYADIMHARDTNAKRKAHGKGPGWKFAYKPRKL